MSKKKLTLIKKKSKSNNLIDTLLKLINEIGQYPLPRIRFLNIKTLKVDYFCLQVTWLNKDRMAKQKAKQGHLDPPSDRAPQEIRNNDFRPLYFDETPKSNGNWLRIWRLNHAFAIFLVFHLHFLSEQTERQEESVGKIRREKEKKWGFHRQCRP